MTRSIGIYPGTFDPIHRGHIAFALAAIEACNLDKVVFLPEKNPRSKQHVTALSHRKELIKKAIQTYPSLNTTSVLSSQFTVHETLPELRERFIDSELTLLIGSDIARTISQWPEVNTLLQEVRLVIGMRSKDSETEIKTNLPSTLTRITFIKTNFASETSSQIRNGNSPYFNPEMARYASMHSLYTPQASIPN